MAHDSLGRLAQELKHFLASQDEDEFIIPAAAGSAAADVSRPSENTAPAPVSENPSRMAEGETLTVEFPRARKRATQSTPSTKAPAPLSPSFNQEPSPMMMTTAQKTTALEELAQTIRNCSRCPLGSTRIHAVPGEGNVDADLMFVGEGPGFDEDRQGRPFVGRAGQLLDKMIAAMGLKREEVFIANIAKCHPMTDPLHPEKHGNDRAPNATEIACCRKYLEQQISIICPKYIVALGGVSAKALIADAKSLGALRGKFYDLSLDSVSLPRPVKILATFHPAALLRNPGWKKDAWADLQMVMAELGLKGASK